jgi:hypothetical protein
MLPKYTPSGKVSPLLALAVPVLLFVAIVSAILYEVLVTLIPLIYVEWLILLFYSVGLGYLIKLALRLTKVRNASVGGIVGVSVGLTALLSAWGFTYLAWRVSQPADAPVGLLDCLNQLSATGWTLGRHGSGIPIKGIFVYLIWLIEAAVILFITLGGGFEGGSTPFCEQCSVSATKKDRTFLVPGLSPETIESLTKAEDLEALLTPALSDIKASESGVEYAVRKCPRCSALGFLTLANVQVTTDPKRKKKETKRTDLHKEVELNADEIEAIGRLEADAGEAVRLSAQVGEPTRTP